MSEASSTSDDRNPTNDNPYRRVIAIDGPAAAGKSTVARALADRLGAILLDTGLLYRATTLAALNAGVDLGDGEVIARLADPARIAVVPAGDGRAPERVLIDGEDVTAELRSAKVDGAVSQVSAHRSVRAALLPVQRAIAAGGKVVMVGRDTTTVVVPTAGVRVYLDASAEERARRRAAEFRARGRKTDFDEVLADIRRRDQADSTREVAPLRPGLGAIVVQTDGKSLEEVVDEIAAVVLHVWERDRDELA